MAMIESINLRVMPKMKLTKVLELKVMYKIKKSGACMAQKEDFEQEKKSDWY